MSWTTKDSIQRVPAPARSAQEVANYYFQWVDERVPGVYARVEPDGVELGFAGAESAAIILRPSGSAAELVKYAVVGGFMVAPRAGGEIAFERHGNEVEIALRDFTPRLPHWLFRMTHGPVHTLVMGAFCRHMRTPRLEEQLE